MNLIYKMNDRYFNTWSHDMAYILGYITADGCVVCNNGKYELIVVSKDLDVIEYITDQLEYGGKIGQSSDGCYRVAICRKNVVMDIMAHGILPRKSWSPVLPDTPDEYREDIIRGLFDGDGTVYISRDNTKGYTKLASEISAISKPFLQVVGGVISKLNGSIPKIYVDPCQPNKYRLMYACKESVALYHMLYDNCKTYSMGRKKVKFEEWLVGYKKDIDWGLRSCILCHKKFVALHDNSVKCMNCR